MTDLQAIISQFDTAGQVASVTPFGSGHINDSYLVLTNPDMASDYVLQRINHDIFSNVPELTGNIRKVTGYLRQQLTAIENLPDSFQVIQPIGTHEGHNFFRDHAGNYWRLYNHIRNSISYDLVLNPGFAYQGGRAFGIFHRLAAGFEASSLYEVLPDFHNIETRLASFREIVLKNPEGRAGEIENDIRFVTNRAEEMKTILNLGRQQQIPLRVTHNDTKFNNVLFNECGQAISVVDLDTVMPGYILYDFGDAIRTGAGTAAEDEADLSKIEIDMELFAAYAAGFLSQTHAILTRAETEHLAFSAKFMTYIIGLRFLTDHVNGDHYFKTGFPGHNLQRARAQFKLLQSMEMHFAGMQDTIKTLSRDIYH